MADQHQDDIAEARELIEFCSDTMGLTRDGAIRRMQVLMNTCTNVLDKLSAAKDENKRLLAIGLETHASLQSWVNGAGKQISALEANLQTALEALEPFAKCAAEWIPPEDDDEEWAKFRLLVKDYRRAHAAFTMLQKAQANG